MSSFTLPTNALWIPNATPVPINASLSGDNVIISGVGGKVIYVTFYFISPHADVIVTWESSGGLVIGGGASFIQKGGVVCGPSRAPLLKTVKGEGLILNLSGAVQVGGHLTYILTDS